jgi:hypothetical protein
MPRCCSSGRRSPDTRRMFGTPKHQVDPVGHLVGTALVCGGLPDKDALYLQVTPARNDADTIHTITVRDVPSTASSRSPSTTPRAIWNRTNTMPMR